MNKSSVILPFGKRIQLDKTKRKDSIPESIVIKGSSTQTVCLQTVVSLVRMRSPVQIRLSAPKKTSHKRCLFYSIRMIDMQSPSGVCNRHSCMTSCIQASDWLHTFLRKDYIHPCMMITFRYRGLHTRLTPWFSKTAERILTKPFFWHLPFQKIKMNKMLIFRMKNDTLL